MKKLLPLVMAVVMVGSVVLMVMFIREKTSAQKFRDQSKQLIEQANAATSKAKGELKQTQLVVAELREEIKRLGPPVEVGPPVPRPPRGGIQIGTIQNHDPQLDFYVINAGSDSGIKKGDNFTIIRGGKAIGKIEIARTQPTVSIAVYQKGFPRPSAPFTRGDKIMKVE